MSKKRKYTFTDLADDDFIQKTTNNFVSNDILLENDNIDSKIKFNLNDLKETNEKITNNTYSKNFDIKENTVEKKELENLEEKNKLIRNNHNSENTVKKDEKKIYEVNYDDILNDKEVVDKKDVMESFFEKKDPIKDLFTSEPKSKKNFDNLNKSDENKLYKNLKPRSTIKTYNEAIKKQEINKSENYFEEDKIKQFLYVKEKLEVKTNIYLKSSIVIKLKELEERTNESRSSIINKLIEMALKSIE